MMMAEQEVSRDLTAYAREIRKLTIETIGRLGVGHIGGSLSIVEALAVLYFHEMKVKVADPLWEDRDRFVLSKGHGGPALYATLVLKGFLDKEALLTLNQPGTNLPSHCDRVRTRGIDMSTGSLGQGFSAAIGMAKAAQMDQKDLTVYTLIGDGESQEGQIWEGALFAAAHGLKNLIAFTDYNKMQIDGYVDEVIGLDSITDKWQAFGWYVRRVDGHDMNAILGAIKEAKAQATKPSMIILDTIKGKGAAFCENLVSSHNMKVSEDQWQEAVQKIEEEGTFA